MRSTSTLIKIKGFELRLWFVPLVLIIFLYLAEAACASDKINAASCTSADRKAMQRTVDEVISSAICTARGVQYRLSYVPLRGTISVNSGDQSTLIETIPKNYRPDIVGGADRIRFLPIELQTFQNLSLIHI